MIRLVFLLAIVLAAPYCAYADTEPFDMSPERPAEAPANPQPNPPPVAVTPIVPPVQAPPVAPPPPPVVSAPAPQKPIEPAKIETPVSLPTSGQFRRYIIPASQFALEGEYDEKTWSIYLTPEQAASPAKFNIGYQNAVVIAPEVSKLSILINNRDIVDQAIQSPDNATQLAFEIPIGLLQAGSNLITLRADQRHRTDCTVASTYELWSDIDPSDTFISFANADAAKLSSIDAVRAIGVDAQGLTGFDFVVPALEQPGTTKPLMRLAQGLAILGGMPNQSFTFRTDGLSDPGPGKLTVVVGTASELQALMPQLPAALETVPLATFTVNPTNGAPMLLVGGPSWQSIGQAIDNIVSPTDRATGVRSDTLVTQRWHSPDAPLLFSDSRLTFQQLGIQTGEFSGRRFRTTFNVAVPADFYANSYGEATILLDAAYAAGVLPGSHIDVYVNGNIASTVPITSSGGGIYRHLPIRVTMRHFRPGVNAVTLEAIVQTSDDATCGPGVTGSTTPRFALFDTSEFHMPDFARIAQRPNLAATSGTGYPYGFSADPIPLFIDRAEPDTLSAAATFLGQLAMMAGHPLSIDAVSSAAMIGDRDAIFVGAISQMPQMTLSQLNIAAASQASWRSGDNPANNANTETTFDEWRSRVRGGNWFGQISVFEDWLRRNFDISWSSLQFAAGTEKTFTPANTATFMIAQGASPDGGGTWTMITAPSAKDLRDGVTSLTHQQNWQKISGHVTTYAQATGKVESVPVTRFDFISTQAMSIGNLRLIFANWLSTNVLSYALALVVLAVCLGLATSGMLSNLGRRR